MTTEPEDELVGRGHPPKAHRWRKGQTGNPRRIRGNNRKPMWQVIEDVLLTEISITENGQPRPATLYAAIVLQLWKKAANGSKRGHRQLKRYEAFAKAKPDNFVRPGGPTQTAQEANEEFRKLIENLR